MMDQDRTRRRGYKDWLTGRQANLIEGRMKGLNLDNDHFISNQDVPDVVGSGVEKNAFNSTSERPVSFFLREEKPFSPSEYHSDPTPAQLFVAQPIPKSKDFLLGERGNLTSNRPVTKGLRRKPKTTLPPGARLVNSKTVKIKAKHKSTTKMKQLAENKGEMDGHQKNRQLLSRLQRFGKKLRMYFIREPKKVTDLVESPKRYSDGLIKHQSSIKSLLSPKLLKLAQKDRKQPLVRVETKTKERDGTFRDIEEIQVNSTNNPELSKVNSIPIHDIFVPTFDEAMPSHWKKSIDNVSFPDIDIHSGKIHDFFGGAQERRKEQSSSMNIPFNPFNSEEVITEKGYQSQDPGSTFSSTYYSPLCRKNDTQDQTSTPSSTSRGVWIKYLPLSPGESNTYKDPKSLGSSYSVHLQSLRPIDADEGISGMELEVKVKKGNKGEGKNYESRVLGGSRTGSHRITEHDEPGQANDKSTYSDIEIPMTFSGYTSIQEKSIQICGHDFGLII